MDSKSRTPESLKNSPPPGEERAEPQSTQVPPLSPPDPAEEVSSDVSRASGFSSIGSVALTGMAATTGAMGAADPQIHVDVAPTHSDDLIEQAIERQQGTYELKFSPLDGKTLIVTFPVLTAALTFLKEVLQLLREWRRKGDKEAEQPELPPRLIINIPGRSKEITIKTAGDLEVVVTELDQEAASPSTPGWRQFLTPDPEGSDKGQS